MKITERKFSIKELARKIAASLTLCACLFVFAACRKSDNSSLGSTDLFGLSDQTAEAGQTIAGANEDLKKIKQMYRENQGQIDDLKAAMDAKDVDKVKKIADDLVYIINDGFVLGESAMTKIQKAEEMNTNETYREYLRMKEASLRKQLDAFEFRRQAAVLLRDAFGKKDKADIEKAKAEFKDREENFQKYMQAARELSDDANQIAKDSLRAAN